YVVYLPACNIRDIVTQFLTAITSCIRDVSMKYFDFVVICTRVAGLRYALEVATHGNVAIITKAEPHESNTNYAQGGVSDVLCPSDSVESHMQDTIVAGAYLCDEETVRVVCTEGPARIRELIAMSASFDHGEDGNLHLAREGGHSHHRIVHAADMTGRERLKGRFLRQLKKIPILRHGTADPKLCVSQTRGQDSGREVWRRVMTDSSECNASHIASLQNERSRQLNWSGTFSPEVIDAAVILFRLTNEARIGDNAKSRYYVYESNIKWDGCGKPKIERQVKADALSQEMDSLFRFVNFAER
ncbi:L-aspartate oxidase, chloroplastic, partial [Tanacetum coccineum]